MTATQTQLRRGTSAQVAAMTPVEAEVVVNTSDDRLHVGDGVKAGGYPVPNVSDIQNSRLVYPTVGGTANAITLTNSVPITAYAAGQSFLVKIGTSSTSSVTVNVDGIGVKDVKYLSEGVLTAFDSDTVLTSAMIYELIYDGTQFQVQGSGLASSDPFIPATVVDLTSVADYVATVDFTTYSSYDIFIYGARRTSGATTIELSQNSGSSYASKLVWGNKIITSTASAATEEWAANNTFFNLSATIFQGSTSGASFIKSEASAYDTANGTAQSVNTASKVSTTAAVNRLKLSTGGNNFESGTLVIQPRIKR